MICEAAFHLPDEALSEEQVAVLRSQLNLTPYYEQLLKIAKENQEQIIRSLSVPTTQLAALTTEAA